MRKKELTLKQRRFAEEYVKTDNASEAYRRAYNAERMKEATIVNNAYKLLKNNEVATIIKELQAKAAEVAEEKFKIDSEALLRKLIPLTNSDISNYVTLVHDENNKPSLVWKPFSDLTAEQKLCIQSVRETRNGIELTLHNKEWSIEKIAKHIGFYEKDNKQKQVVEAMTFRVIDDK